MTQLVAGYPCDREMAVKYAPEYQSALIQQTLLLPGGGCAYYRAQKGDACTFCAFPGFIRSVIKGEGFEHDFSSWKLPSEIYHTMLETLTANNHGVERLAIFNGGSFFPNSELPGDFQRSVYQYAATHPTIKQLFVEGYPNFISKAKLVEAKSLLGDKDLLVGVGFESANDTVRNTMLKKGIDKRVFEQKVALMHELGVQVSVYVFLKAPQLTEYQAYQDVVATLRYLHDLGVAHMALSCAFVPENTPLATLYHSGGFRPPWLWTITEIKKLADKEGWPLTIGGFDDTPPPVAGPSNCAKCNGSVLGAIERSRREGYLDVTAIPTCECQQQWQPLFQREQEQVIV
ncbi:hypothetical protein HGP28_16405 [Vibrio sp. SM6]|uniref:Elp3/MiaA/NifB-like radical SAM core domain-containing protein n=1 Tax=Vibrio agarilyticus TaxID=2726741 RepID=A0A7X8YHU2_9VIBR|nr:hypothetical protein [Vibrio agarilyticus]NLS14453.1 hypothetical protein [Vibrio agarilyticus]